MIGFLLGIGNFFKSNPKLLVTAILIVLFIAQDVYVYHKGKSNALAKVEAKSLIAYQREINAQAKLQQATALRNEKIQNNFEKQKNEIIKSIEGVPQSVQDHPSPSDCVAPDDELKLLNDLISKTAKAAN